MQRTLLELQFFPVGYLPAFTFKGAERCDAVRMARLFVPASMEGVELFEETQPIADIVLSNFATHELLPRLSEALPTVPLFAGLTSEQLKRIAEICKLENYPGGKKLIEPGNKSENAFVILDGKLVVKTGGGDSDTELGTITIGGCLGETALLREEPHSVLAEATEPTEAAVLAREKLIDLIRRRPDIGVTLYRNLAQSLGDKLRTADGKLIANP